MSSATIVSGNQAINAGGTGTDQLKLDNLSMEKTSDASEFRAILNKYMQPSGAPNPVEKSSNNLSLGDKMMSRATSMAEEIKKDQHHVSTMLEQASRNGDSMQMMKAMMALNDYQMRVQFISKAATKATGALDQLTKLQ